MSSQHKISFHFGLHISIQTEKNVVIEYYILWQIQALRNVDAQKNFRCFVAFFQQMLEDL